MFLNKKGHICNHPGQYPYDPYTGKRNEPCEVDTCECGECYQCPKCGLGVMALPHTCKVVSVKGQNEKNKV
jgi:hypothetical protein